MSIDTAGLDFLWTDTTDAPTVTLPTSDRPRRQKWTAEEIKQKIENCREAWKRFFRAENGKQDTKPFLCRIFHSEHGHCQECLEYRADQLRLRIRQAMKWAELEGLKVFCADVPADKRRQMARKYGKQNYLACPQPDGKVRVFYQSASSDDVAGARQLDDTFGKQYWVETAQTPIGQNMSGNLGKPVAPATGDETENEDMAKEKKVKIEITEVVVRDISAKDEDAALKIAYLETIDLQPKTPAEVEAALKKRTQIYIREINKRGGAILHTEQVKHKVLPSAIKWDTGASLLGSEMATPPREKGMDYWYNNL